MKQLVFASIAACVIGFAYVGSAIAVTPAQEKDFIAAYKSAASSKDGKALQSLLYTKGADLAMLDMFKMMFSIEQGATINTITLVDLTAADQKKLASAAGPNGQPMKMTLKPVKKLLIKTSTKSANGSSSGESEIFVAEADGKLVIPVPASGK
jgi:hypothetical protein